MMGVIEKALAVAFVKLREDFSSILKVYSFSGSYNDT